MRKIAAFLVIAGLEATAAAQVCSQASPGVAEVDTNGVAVTLSTTAAGILKVNGASCGFAPTAIVVVGVVGKDTVTFNYVPPTVDVTVSLATGPNNVTVFATNGDDSYFCRSDGLDRNADATNDFHLDPAEITSLTLNGRGGNDTLDCAAAAYKVVLNGGDGDDVLFAGPFNDTLDGGRGADGLFGNGGNDNLNGNDGDDDVEGGAGNDTFVTRSVFDGHDTYVGGPGTDNLAYSGRTAPVIIGGAGSEDSIADDVETIKGGKSSDTLDFTTATAPHNLYGGAGNDTIRGGAGADKLYGEANDDYLVGNGARDLVIDAGDGNDSIGPMLDGNAETIKCGAGLDTFENNPEDTFKDCEISTSVPFASPHHIAAAGWHACGILADGRVKCWGYSPDGELGIGDTANHGDDPGEMGAALPTVPLGTGRTAISISTGPWTTCALLDDATVKCWGYNAFGQLGQGDTANRGDSPNELGNNLPPINLGTGHTARAIAAGAWHTCAILDDYTVKCWGGNALGELGLGDTIQRGDNPGEMGDSLPTVDLGPGRTARAIDADFRTTCALLDNGAVKCWGANDAGQLGQGDTIGRGDNPNEMGTALAGVNLGTGRAARAVDVAGNHACAVLDNNTVKCWGANESGQLGVGDTGSRGDQPGEMGDALPAVDLGTNRTATAIIATASGSCALRDNGTILCWGYGGLGTLGNEQSLSRGDEPNELGDASLPALLGASRTALELAGNYYTVCAKLDDSTAKCWGMNSQGQLGQGDTLQRGDAPGQMGDALPPINLNGSLDLARPFLPGADSLADVTETDAIDDGLDVPDDDATAADFVDDAGDDSTDVQALGCSTSRGGSLPLALGLAFVVATRRRRR